MNVKGLRKAASDSAQCHLSERYRHIRVYDFDDALNPSAGVPHHAEPH
jgi:hypothetical protein